METTALILKVTALTAKAPGANPLKPPDYETNILQYGLHHKWL